MRRLPLLLAAVLLPLSPSLAGCGPADACSQTADTPDGLTVSRGLVTATMHLDCAQRPDAFDFTLILVRDGAMLKPGKTNEGKVPPPGFEVQTFAECRPGRWHVYYLATWSYQGQTTSNSSTTLADRTVTDGDCRSHGG